MRKYLTAEQLKKRIIISLIIEIIYLTATTIIFNITRNVFIFTLAIIPIAVIGWLLGTWAPLLFGILQYFISLLLINMSGYEINLYMILRGTFFSVYQYAVGMLIGKFSEIRHKAMYIADELENANKEKTDYFINLAHEVKTPLTLIINYLNKYISKNGMNDDLGIINENILKLKKNMINFLDYEKLEKGQLFYDHSQITDLSSLLKDSVILFRDTASLKKIDIRLNLINNVIIQVDPYAVDRIIYNLLDNAVKFTNPNGIITVILKSMKSDIELIIKDTGIGISEEQLLNIFKSYYQISHKKSNIQGIGMGLNIIKKIIDDIDGRIEVKSKINEGTEFKVYLKKYSGSKNNIKFISKEDKEKPVNIIHKDISSNEIEDKTKHTILLVEDNLDMLAYLIDSLKDQYNVFIAKDGIEALDKLNMVKRLNIVVSDIMMDRMNGYEFFEEFRNNEVNKGIPFIFLTAKNTQAEKIKALKKGAVDFINKPFDVEELKAKIYTLIELEESQYERYKKKLMGKVINELNIDRKKDPALIFEKKCTDNFISPKEKNVILLLIDGKFNKEIAHELNISVNTVKFHINRIYKKCMVQNKVELINLFKE